MIRTATILLASVLAGCASVPAGVSAQQAPTGAGTAPRTVQVNAQASVTRVPDRATIDLAVETTAATARDATSRNAETMQAVLDAVKKLGVADRSIRTRRVDLAPQYDRKDPSQIEITGYRAANQVSVQLDDLDQLGAVIDAAVSAGANRVTGIGFEVKDPDAAYHEALRAAIARAKDEAQTVADALGETLGPPIEISTGGFSPPPSPVRFEAAQMRAGSGFAPPVQPGETEIQASVSIRFRLGT